MNAATMKAITYHQYGTPDVLHLTTLEIPMPKNNEVLIKIHATTVTAGDWRLRKAEPFVIRFFSGLSKPKNPVLGHELAGEIIAVGRAVKNFQRGDLVFGTTGFASGTYAEYISVPEDSTLAIKPMKLTSEEAAAMPIGAMTALFFLKKANIKHGQKVLIHGASGSIGSAAVQLAKSFGAIVTGVCSTRNIDLVQELGADQVIDYTKEDFTKSDETYDIIFNTVGKTSFAQTKHLLTPNGVYVASNATLTDYLQMIFNRKKIIAGIAEQQQENLLYIKKQIEAGQLNPVIDRYYPLEETAEAHRYVEQGHKKGNVVIKIKS